MAATKQIQQLARQFYRLSFIDGELSAERVAGILEYVEKHRPSHAAAVLKAYHRLVAAAVARGQAVIEHAGPVDPAAVATVTATLSGRYGRPITSMPRRNDALIAGLRVRVGDDVYESSVAGQLAVLAVAG